MEFEFKPELFEYRAAIMEVLAAAGFWWLSAFRSIDVDHQDMFLEVDGIPDKDTARGIAKRLADKFPWGIRAYERDYTGDWVVMILVRGKGFSFGGHADGRPWGHPSIQPEGTKPEEETVDGGPVSDAEAERGAVDEKPDGEPDGAPVVNEPSPEEASPDAPDDHTPRIPMAAFMGEHNIMTTKPPEPDALARYAKLLHALSRRGDCVPTIVMHVPVAAHGIQGDDWNGQVRVIVRLKDVRFSIGQLRQVIPLLQSRSDLLNLLAEALLVAHRDRLDKFVADLPPGAASRYEALANKGGIWRHGLMVVEPSKEESWRIVFTTHCMAISAVLDDELQRAAAEAE